MAGKIRAETDVAGTVSKQGRAKAEAAFAANGAEKKAKAPVILAVEGHNGPKPREMQDMYLEAKALREKVDTASARYRKFLATCKERGLQPAVITAMMRWEKQDPDEAKAHWRAFRKLHEATNQEIQMDLFTGTAAPVSRQAEIFDLGYKCGVRGGNHDESQWDAGTPLGQIWLSGHAAGVTEAARIAFDKPTDTNQADQPPTTTH